MSSRVFYWLVLGMACAELLRFLEMLFTGEYCYKSVYCLHVVGGSLFFTAFSIVCYQWAKLLHVGIVTKIMFGRSGLLVANIIFICIDIVSIGICAVSSSLHEFFYSTYFIVLTVIEAVKNTTYAAALSYYGISLVWKLWNLSQTERRNIKIGTAVYRSIFYSSNHNSISEEDFDLKGEEMKNCEENGSRTKIASNIATHPTEANFLGVIIRITFVLLLTTICFALRVTMIAMKLTAMHTSLEITKPTFAMFGVA